jgi:hypothetical protein
MLAETAPELARTVPAPTAAPGVDGAVVGGTAAVADELLVARAVDVAPPLEEPPQPPAATSARAPAALPSVRVHRVTPTP